VPKRKSSHEKEAVVKMRKPLILQPDIAIRSTGFGWNIYLNPPFYTLQYLFEVPLGISYYVSKFTLGAESKIPVATMAKIAA
jgi:hypothetical protein